MIDPGLSGRGGEWIAAAVFAGKRKGCGSGDQFFHAEIVDRHACQLEVVALDDPETAFGEEARSRLTRLDEQAVYAGLSRGVFEPAIDQSGNAGSGRVWTAIEVVDVPVGLQVAIG